ALYAFIILLLLLAVLVVERIRYRVKYEQKIKNITQNIKNATAYGSIKYDKKEKEPFIDALYKSVEELRKKLKRKNRILQAVLDLVNTLAVNIEIESLVDVVLSRLIEETNSNWGVFYIYNANTE